MAKNCPIAERATPIELSAPTMAGVLPVEEAKAIEVVAALSWPFRSIICCCICAIDDELIFERLDMPLDGCCTTPTLFVATEIFVFGGFAVFGFAVVLPSVAMS